MAKDFIKFPKEGAGMIVEEFYSEVAKEWIYVVQESDGVYGVAFEDNAHEL